MKSWKFPSFNLLFVYFTAIPFICIFYTFGVFVNGGTFTLLYAKYEICSPERAKTAFSEFKVIPWVLVYEDNKLPSYG